MIGNCAILPFAKIPVSGKGVYSPSVSIWPADIPTVLIATTVTDVQINLAWTNVDTKGDGVKVYISTDNITFTLKGTVALGIATYSATGLTQSTLYYFYVVAYKGGKESDSSNFDSDTTLPAIPTGLTATLISEGVKWDWTDNSGGAAQTEIWCRNDSAAYTTVTYTINAGTVTKSETTAAVDLRYCKIRSLKGGLYSPFTGEVSIAMLGANLVTPANASHFATDGTAAWGTITATKAWDASGFMRVTATGAVCYITKNILGANKKYRVKSDIKSVAFVGKVSVQGGAGVKVQTAYITSNWQACSVLITKDAGGDGLIYISADVGIGGTIDYDNIIVQQVLFP